jgi:hypothetical protein
VVRQRAPQGSLCVLLLIVGVKFTTEDGHDGRIQTRRYSFISSGAVEAATKPCVGTREILVFLPLGLTLFKKVNQSISHKK